MKRPKVLRRRVRPDLTALNGAGDLIESKVDPAKHPRVVDVVTEHRRQLVRNGIPVENLIRSTAGVCHGRQREWDDDDLLSIGASIGSL